MSEETQIIISRNISENSFSFFLFFSGSYAIPVGTLRLETFHSQNSASARHRGCPSPVAFKSFPSVYPPPLFPLQPHVPLVIFLGPYLKSLAACWERKLSPSRTEEEERMNPRDGCGGRRGQGGCIMHEYLIPTAHACGPVKGPSHAGGESHDDGVQTRQGVRADVPWSFLV